MIVLLGALAAGALALIFLLILTQKNKGNVTERDAQMELRQAVPRRTDRMQAGMRRRRAGARGVPVDQAETQDGLDDDQGEVGRRAVAGQGEAGVAQELREKKRDAYEAKRKAKDAERQAQEEAQEEEIRRAAEDRQRREEEEAAKWMHLFTVEAAGESALSAEQTEVLMARMVDHLKARKTVPVDELAAEFGLKTVDAVAKLQALEAEGRITGVMDDRGKFIFISPEEMAAVADFIQQRGRISISELAQRSNMLIDLSPKELAGDAADLDLDLPLSEGVAAA